MLSKKLRIKKNILSSLILIFTIIFDQYGL